MTFFLIFIVLLFAVPSAFITGYFLDDITRMILGTSPTVSFWLTTIVSFLIFFVFYFNKLSSDESPKEARSSAFPAVVAGFILGRLTK